MATRAPDHRITLAEYLSLEDPDERWEVDAGRLVREPQPGGAHGAIVANIAHALRGWADEHGGAVLAGSGFVLAEEPLTVRGPDVAWVSADRAGYGVPSGLVPGAPDLAVEIVSPSNSAAGIQSKVLQYLDAGARAVWVVHPSTRTVVVHPDAAHARLLREDDDLDGGTLLPGLSLPLSRLFR